MCAMNRETSRQAERVAETKTERRKHTYHFFMFIKNLTLANVTNLFKSEKYANCVLSKY